MGLRKDLADGQKREISAEDYQYWLEVLPPPLMGFQWGGERWDFGAAEGLETVIAFQREGDRYFAKQTDILNPEECGVSVEDQAAGKADGMKRRLEQAHRTAKGEQRR